MRKILIFFLILASFSCATLDNDIKDVKEDSKIQKAEKIEESKKEVDVVVPNDDGSVVSKTEKSENAEQTIHSTEESESIPIVQKEDVISNNSSKTHKGETEGKKEEESKKEEKTESKKEEKVEEKELQKNDEDISLLNNELKENKENVKNSISDEMALQQEYNDLFINSSKVELKEEKKEEQIKVLPSLEILKELEDAINLFKKESVSIGIKQRVEKKEKEVKAEKVDLDKLENTDEELETPEVAKKDEDTSSKETSMLSSSDLLSNDDDEPLYSFNDEESTFDFNDDDSQFRFNDEEPQPFSFDDEKKDEKESKSADIQDNKGQLSSVVDEEDKVNISRYTNIIKGQNIDFSYPGEGWVYLGEETSQKGLNYIKRKMEDGKTFFTFTAENVGNYVLNFSYFDVFSGDYIVDAVSVKVVSNDDGIQKDSLVLEYQGKNGKNTTEEKLKKTPDEVNVDADKVGISTEQTSKIGETSSQQPTTNAVERSKVDALSSATSNDSSDNSNYREPEVFTNVAKINPENAKSKISGEDAKKIISEVSEAISSGNAKKALERLDDFFAVSSTNMDEAYFLRGKAYELNTEQKNIKMALAAYKFLTKTFPDSPFWNEADARIRYIEKFFIKIK